MDGTTAIGLSAMGALAIGSSVAVAVSGPSSEHSTSPVNKWIQGRQNAATWRHAAASDGAQALDAAASDLRNAHSLIASHSTLARDQAVTLVDQLRGAGSDLQAGKYDLWRAMPGNRTDPQTLVEAHGAAEQPMKFVQAALDGGASTVPTEGDLASFASTLEESAGKVEGIASLLHHI